MKVFTVLVNWNNAKDTVECIRSLRQAADVDNNVIVVDNGSTDDSLSVLRPFAEEVRLIESETNLGFAGGNNLGIEVALESGAQFVWLLNNDTLVEAGTLRALLECATSDPSIGAVGSKVLYAGQPDTIWYAGGEFHSCGWSKHRGMNEIDAGQYDRAEDTGFLTGCSILASREAIERVGRMDAEYFLYWEDVDWCAKMQAAGLRTVYCPQSRLWHKVSATTSADGGLTSEYEARNRVLFYAKNAPSRTARVAVCTVAQGLWGVARRHPGLAYHYTRGVLLGLRGSTGPL